MSQLRVQIIDSSEALCASLEATLSDAFEIDICSDGLAAPYRIHTFQPDILVMETILPGNDGFHILQAVQASGLRPLVLMITPLLTDYVIEKAAELKVNYLMCKPCNLQAVASCVYNFRDKLEGECHTSDWLASTAKHILLMLNFRTNLCGYRYLLDALLYLHQDMKQSFTKELYPAVAKGCGSSWQQVEHGIRVAIADAWKNRDEGVWSLYFPPGKNGKISKPTNSKMLSRLAQCLSELDSAKKTESPG